MAHHSVRLADGHGDSIASRWPINAVHEVDVPLRSGLGRISSTLSWLRELELGRRMDYILVRCTEHGPTLDITSCHRILGRPVGGVWASDHFGVSADLSALTPLAGWQRCRSHDSANFMTERSVCY